MRKETIVFDLDGTISDPLEGIAASINYALEKLGLSPRSKSRLEKYVGPPLQEAFAELLDQNDNELINYCNIVILLS